ASLNHFTVPVAIVEPLLKIRASRPARAPAPVAGKEKGRPGGSPGRRRSSVAIVSAGADRQTAWLLRSNPLRDLSIRQGLWARPGPFPRTRAGAHIRRSPRPDGAPDGRPRPARPATGAVPHRPRRGPSRGGGGDGGRHPATHPPRPR